MHFSWDQYQALGSIALGLGLIFWPPPKHRQKDEQRQARIAELKNGAAERYFEERRQLEVYGPKSTGPFRLLGVLMLLIGGALLFAG
jgi:hypothetical protein